MWMGMSLGFMEIDFGIIGLVVGELKKNKKYWTNKNVLYRNLHKQFCPQTILFIYE
jgi:hypothetical protein